MYVSVYLAKMMRKKENLRCENLITVVVLPHLHTHTQFSSFRQHFIHTNLFHSSTSFSFSGCMYVYTHSLSQTHTH